MEEDKQSIWEKFYQYKAHHILLWVSYYLFWVSFYIDSYDFWNLILIVTIYFVFNASGFYITGYYLLPRFLYTHKYVLFFLFFVILMVGLSLIQGYFIYAATMEHNEYTTYQNLTKFSFMSLITIVGLLTGAKLVIEKLRTDRTNRLLDKQRFESELQFLRAQVNPHFLFNAINSVYFLIKKKPDQAAETLIRLSDLLRFQLYDCSEEKISIEKELEYLHNFIALEKIRKGEKLHVSIEQQGRLSGFELAPFMLIPFVENAFKHVSNVQSIANCINILLYIEEDKLHVKIENTMQMVQSKHVGGIGLKNVRRRLELLYPGSHELTISEMNHWYSVHLSLSVL